MNGKYKAFQKEEKYRCAWEMSTSDSKTILSHQKGLFLSVVHCLGSRVRAMELILAYLL